jgi:hypothetical protein
VFIAAANRHCYTTKVYLYTKTALLKIARLFLCLMTITIVMVTPMMMTMMVMAANSCLYYNLLGHSATESEYGKHNN